MDIACLGPLSIKKKRYDYEKGTISPDVLEQTEQALRNIEAALAQAGGASLSDVVRVRYILPDRGDFPAAWPALRRCFDDVRPAATMVQAGLMDEAMKIEIEVTAWKPGGDQGAREAGSG